MKLKENFNLEEKKGMMTRYKDAKKNTAYTLNVIDVYCNYFEKYKNLLKWQDPKMTKLFFFFALLALIIVTYLPLRFFIMLSFSYRFYIGKRWNMKRQRSNREVCQIELKNVFEDLKISSEFVDN